MAECPFRVGDLIEFNKKRYVVAKYPGYMSDDSVHALPATKGGKADRRFYGQLLPWRQCKLIKAAPVECRECLDEFDPKELVDGVCEGCRDAPPKERCPACDGTGLSSEWDPQSGTWDCDECGGDGEI